jgi:hypothetical protein
MTNPTKYLADFDSATAMLRALSAYLHGRDFPLLGAMPRWAYPAMKLVAAAVNALPTSLREQVYIWSGRFEAIAARRLPIVQADEIAAWMVGQYPRRPYPAIAVGSSNGAAVHLWAALGIPWLPQTFLVPVARSGIHPDEPDQELRWAEEPARTVLERNPDLQLHHMHDPVQDRLMVQRMGYFRFKRRRLGADYERFLADCLEPGGTIILVECGLRWPVTRYGERHVFQFGALGGATVEELRHGGPRVRDYLRRYGSPRSRWEPPPADEQAPEAEWGFEPALGLDVERFAAAHGYQVRRIRFEQPEAMSPLVADFYEWWNQQRGIEGTRLLIDSFIVMEPYWTLATGSVPFWMVFNKEPSAQALERYLKERPSWDEIYLMLFSHGVDSIGLVPIVEWRRLLRQARERSAFVGVDPLAYPRDFGVFVRYHGDLQAKIRARYPLPQSLTLQVLEQFLARQSEKYHVEWR